MSEAMKITVGRFDAATGKVPVTFEQATETGIKTHCLGRGEGQPLLPVLRPQ